MLQAGDGETNDDILAGLRAYAVRSARFAVKLEADDYAYFTVDTDAVPIKTVADRVQTGIIASGWDPLIT